MAHQTMLYLMPRESMRTTVTLDDELVAEGRLLSGVDEISPLLRTALVALIERESALRLARLGGTMPDIQDVARRRSDPSVSE